MTGTFFGNFDLAQLSLYAFWLFFAGLVIYLQRENQREGYPTENEDGSDAGATFGMPAPKTFLLSHGRGTVTVPNDARDERNFAMERTSEAAGSPYEPTGNPMLDGVGPAAYAMRRDEPELDHHGEPSFQPMRLAEGFRHFAGPDPVGLPVIAGDGETVGKVTDMWIDTGELVVRYLEVELDGGGGRRLIPQPLSKITWKGVIVQSIYAEHFADVPTTKSDSQVTKLEEDKICAYYAGGTLYASRGRLESQLDPLLT